MKHLAYLISLLIYFAGIAIANGFWQTLFALIPFYAYYLVAERLVVKFLY